MEIRELSEIVKENGFESEQEFHKLISNVPLTNNYNIQVFKSWQELDGSKQGLLLMFPELGK